MKWRPWLLRGFISGGGLVDPGGVMASDRWGDEGWEGQRPA